MHYQEENYLNKSDTEVEFATGLGILGTPGFIIGNQIISGVVSYPDLKEIIEAELN